MINWWESYNPREQIIIAILGAALAFFLFFILLIAPVMDWHKSEKNSVSREKELLIDVKQLVAQVKAKGKSGNKKSRKSLSVLIDNSLRKNELVMRGFQPGANRDARLRLENASYSSLMQWLHDLEYDHGISILDLSLRPARVSGRLMVNVRVGQ